jgi:hypothetical protein
MSDGGIKSRNKEEMRSECLSSSSFFLEGISEEDSQLGVLTLNWVGKRGQAYHNMCVSFQRHDWLETRSYYVIISI